MSSTRSSALTSSQPGAATASRPPFSHPLDSPTDHRSVLEVVGWCMAIMAFLVALARMGTKWSLICRLHLDDLLITISLVLAFGQTASLSTAVQHGLGLLPPFADQSEVNLEGQQKSIYTFNVLFVISQCFAKISVTVFTYRFTPVKRHGQICKALIAAIGLWAATAVLALLFQCQLPDPWRAIGGKCVNRVSLYTYVEIANAILDIVLIAVPVFIVWSLHQSWTRKLAIIGTFLTRTTVVAVIIVQLVVLHNGDDNTSPDPFLYWKFAICTQFIEYLSIVSACGLYLGPFVRGAASGMLGKNVAASGTNGYYYQFDRNRFVRTRTVVISGHDPQNLSSFSDTRPLEAGPTLNITVQKEFELYDNVTHPKSAGSDQSSHEIAEQIVHA